MTNKSKITGNLSETTLKNRLIQLGVDVSDPDFRQEMEYNVQRAQELVPEPDDPSADEMPAWFPAVSSKIHASSRLAMMLQVLTVSGGFGPINMAALLIAEWFRVGQSISSFVAEPAIVFLLSGVLVLGYMYLALVKADLKYLIGKTQREAFSLRRVARSLGYKLGIGRRWTAHYITETETEYTSVSKLLVMYKMSIALMTLAASVLSTITTNTVGVWYQQLVSVFTSSSLDILLPVLMGVVLSVLLLFGIDWIIARAHRSYMLSDGARVNTADFLSQLRAQYLEQRRKAGEEARLDFLKMKLMQAQNQAQLDQAPRLISQNGHRETVN